MGQDVNEWVYKVVNVAIVGVSTLTGENLLEILDARELAVDQLFLFDSADEAGRSLMFRNRSVRIRALDTAEPSEIGILFVCDDTLAPAAIEPFRAAGALVIDLFPARFEDALLVVPEINGDSLAQAERGSVVGSPAPAVVAAAMALAPLQREYQLLRLNAVALQSAAELGRAGVEALAAETVRLLNGRDAEPSLLPAQFAFNLIPQTGELDETGVSAAERRFVQELREVLGDEEIEIVVNVLQLPMFYGVTVTLQAETQLDVDLDEAARLFNRADGVSLVQGDKPVTPVGTANGNDLVHLTRLRLEAENPSGFGLCAMTDNLRKGSALNAVQIVERWQALSR